MDIGCSNSVTITLLNVEISILATFNTSMSKKADLTTSIHCIEEFFEKRESDFFFLN